MVQKPEESNEMSSGIASHSKSRSGCITCKTRRVKCDEGKPYCLRCSAAGYNCAGYFESNECTDIRTLKKSKQFHAKSRFGCTTCKNRRVKCDEGKPACLRCTNGGHECGGYDDLQEQKRKSMAKSGSVILLPRFEDNHQVLPAVTLTQSLSVTGSSQDHRSFDFFRTKTVHVLTGFFDHDFWKELLLQISTSEPTVRHAILAVGALHEYHGIDNPDSSRTNRQLALSHYLKAVKLLTGQDKHKAQSTEIVAVTCLLFACIELLLNDISGAIRHIRSGVLMIRSWKANNNRLRRKLTGSDDLIQNYLAPAFDHMNLNSFVYSKTIAPQHVYDNTEEFKHFETLFDARSALYNVRNSIVFFKPTFGVSKDELSPALQREQFLEVICEKWTTAFNSLLARSIHTNSPSFAKGARLLKLQYGIVSLLCKRLLFVPDMELDNLTGTFSELLDYCELVLEIEAGNAPPEFNGTFTLQLRSVWPVYKAALDCRNPTIRRRAVSLLKQQPKRRGFWSSELIINILESAIEIEERGLESLTDCTGAIVPSAWARLKNIVIDVDSMQDSQTALVSFIHKANGTDEAQVERREFASGAIYRVSTSQPQQECKRSSSTPSRVASKEQSSSQGSRNYESNAKDIKDFIKTMHFKAKIVAEDDGVPRQEQLYSKLEEECLVGQEALEEGLVGNRKNIQKYKEEDAENQDVSCRNTITKQDAEIHAHYEWLEKLQGQVDSLQEKVMLKQVDPEILGRYGSMQRLRQYAQTEEEEDVEDDFYANPFQEPQARTPTLPVIQVKTKQLDLDDIESRCAQLWVEDCSDGGFSITAAK